MQIKRAYLQNILTSFSSWALKQRREMFLVLRQFQFVKIAYALFRTYKQERKVLLCVTKLKSI